MLTLLEVLKRTTEYFRTRGIENPRLDAEWLLAHVLGLQRLHLYLQFERPMQERELEELRPLVRRRGAREPLQYVLGETGFFSLTIRTDRRALIPRPETERLVELTIDKVECPPIRILDLGTGTGAILLSLLKHWPEAAGTAVDRSDAAMELARENADSLGMAGRAGFLCSDWYDALDDADPFDLIVSNPPYLSPEEWTTAEPEVKDFEPREALAAEESGRADLKTIIAGAPRHLKRGGLLALETGIAQHDSLTEFARRRGFTSIESVRDHHGRDRYLFLRI